MPKPRFSLGRIVATPAAIQALHDANQSPMQFLTRHASGDWGEVCDEDKQLNEHSMVDGSRLLSAYRTVLGVRIWFITEAANEAGHRAATTILLPDEY